MSVAIPLRRARGLAVGLLAPCAALVVVVVTCGPMRAAAQDGVRAASAASASRTARAPDALAEHGFPTAQWVPLPGYVGRRDEAPERAVASSVDSTLRLDAAHIAYVRAPGARVVRLVAPCAARLRVWRSVGATTTTDAGPATTASGWSALPPAHTAADSLTFLAEDAALWRVESDVDCAVAAMSAEPFVPWRAHADALGAVLAWIARGEGPMPVLPPGSGAWHDALAFDAALAERLAPVVPREVRDAYRRGAAVLAFLEVQPLDARLLRMTEPEGAWRTLQQEHAGPGAGLRRIPRTAQAELVVEGPSVVALALRAAGPAEPASRSAHVFLDDTTLCDVPLSAVRAAEADVLPQGLPVTQRLDAVAPADAHGLATALRVRVPAGRHRLRVQAEGGDVLIDARALAHRPRFSHWLSGDESPEARFAEVADVLAGLDAEARARPIWRALADALAQRGGARIGIARPSLETSARLLAGLEPAPATDDRAASFAWLVAHAGEPPVRHALVARCDDAAEEPLDASALADVRDVLAAARCARRLVVPPSHVVSRVRAAWRAEPLRVELAEALRRLASAPRAWVRLPDDAGPSLRVLAPASPEDTALLVPLDATPRALALPASPLVPGRPARVVVHVLGERDADAVLRVDGAPLVARTTGALERWSLALPPGPHTLAAEGARVFLRTEVAPAGAAAAIAAGAQRVRTLRLLAAGDEARWASPADAWRIEARALDGGPTTLVARWSNGDAETLRIDASAPDATLLGATCTVSLPLRVALVPPVPGATLTLRVDAGRAAVAVYAVRDADIDAALAMPGAETPADAPTDPPAPVRVADDDASRLEALRAASEALAVATSDAEIRAARRARAEALLRLGREARARSELARTSAPDVDGARRDALAQALPDGAHLAIEGAPLGVLPLWPYELAVRDNALRQSAREAAQRATSGRARAAAEQLFALAASGARDAAASAALSLAALGLAADALVAEPDPEFAALVFARARGLSVASPARRRAEAVAGRLTRWQSVGVAASAGFERVELLGTEPAAGEEVFARALLGLAPADPALLLWPGQRARLRGTGRVTDLALRCGEALESVPTDAGCVFELSRDERVVATVQLAGGTRREVPLAGMPAGAALVVALADVSDAPGAIAVVGTDEVARRRLDAHVATPDHEVVQRVAGPGALELELRALGGAGVDAELLLEAGGEVRRRVLPLPRARAEARLLPRRPGAVGARELVTLPIDVAGPVTLRTRARQGAALVRARLRVPRDRAEAPAADAMVRGEDAPLPFALSETPAQPAPSPFPIHLGPRRDAGRLGALSVALGVLSHDVGEADDVARPTSYAGLTVTHRLALVPGALWMRTEFELRARRDVPLALGGRAALQAVVPWIGLRAGLDGRLDALDDGSAWAAGGVARLDRPIVLAPALTITPRVRFDYAWQSAGQRGGAAAVDFEVWNPYRRDHPVQLQPSLAVRVDPAPDARLELSVGAATNADLYTLDRVEAALGLAAVTDLFTPRSLLVRVGYRPGLRVIDTNRRDGYWRHDLQAELALHHTLGAAARLVFTLSGTAFVRDIGIDGLALATLRLDLLDGRGLRDLAPSEASFAGILAPAGYLPGAPR
jgi:hypothetical protein